MENNLKLYFTCSRCAGDLTYEFSSSGGAIFIEIDPCGRCLLDAKEETRKKEREGKS